MGKSSAVNLVPADLVARSTARPAIDITAPSLPLIWLADDPPVCTAAE
jgi:hypothetical protein